MINLFRTVHVQLYYVFLQVALGEPGKQKLYPQVTGKEEWRKKMIEMFPGESSAINKYIDLLHVR